MAGIDDQELLEVARKLCQNVDIRTRFYHLIAYKDCFLGTDAVKAIINLGLAADETMAISLGNVMLQAQLIQHVTNSQYFKNERMFYRFNDVITTMAEMDLDNLSTKDDSVSASGSGSHGGSEGSSSKQSNGFGGLSLRSTQSAKQQAIAEAHTIFLLEFTPIHEKEQNGVIAKYFSGGEAVSFILENSSINKEKRAIEVAQKLLSTRQILYFDPKISETKFDLAGLYVLARDVRKERQLLDNPFVGLGFIPIFNPYGENGLELFGLDGITTRIILCIISAYLLVRLVLG
eukprot:CFRG6721T1